jgi:hypothetical protein
MNADGSGLIDLAHLRRGCDGGPSFAADGRRIVFGTYDDVKDVEGLATMDLDDQVQHRPAALHRLGRAMRLSMRSPMPRDRASASSTCRA